MNINKKIATETDFNIHYSTIYRELTKIANNLVCNAIVAYNSIFSIAISQNGYEEKLYWYIGDFMYVCAKERRAKIFSSDDWFESYCQEFERYTLIVEGINAICIFLNDVLVKNEKGRRICDFGYLLWDRCVLQNVEPSKKISLCDELLKRIETPSLNYKKALLSLKKIIPDPEYPLYFYEHYYEGKALDYIKDVYSSQLCFEDFSEYVAQAEEIFQFETQRMNLIFLEESHPKVVRILEDICVTYHQSYIYNCVFLLVSTNQPELKNVFTRIGMYSKQFCDLIRKAIRNYIENVTLKELQTLHTYHNDDFLFFDSLKKIHEQSIKLINPYFDNELRIDDLFTKKFNELFNRTYNERLISFFDKIMLKDCYNDKISTFGIFLRFVNDFSSFGHLYQDALKKRLLTYRYIFIREKENLEHLRTIIDVITYKKCMKMIRDVNWSIVFNKLLVPFLETDINLAESAQLSYFTSILNLCAWPLDCDYEKRIKLGNQQQSYYNALESYFTNRYPDRRLIWLWEDSTVYIEFITDKTYTLKMDILHSTAFLCFSDYDKLRSSDLEDLTNIRESDLNKILNNFVAFNILTVRDNAYTLNADFYSTNKKIYIQQTDNKQEIMSFDFRMYYKAVILKKIAKSRSIEKNRLEGTVIFEHCENQDFNKAAYEECLQELINDHLIELRDNVFVSINK